MFKVGSVNQEKLESFGLPWKVYENTELWKGGKAFCFQYHKGDEDKIENVINFFNTFVSYNKIESKITRAEAEKHAKWLIDSKNYTYHLDPNGTPFDELSEEDKMGIGYSSSGSRWSKWTVDEILRKNGWYDDDLVWFSLEKDNTYTYQIILQDGMWLYFAPFLSHDNEPFGYVKNTGIEDAAPLPYMYDWAEVKFLEANA